MKATLGTIEWRNNKQWLQGFVTEIEESAGDDVFIRYQTNNMMGLMEPLLKVDVIKKRCYFLTDRCANGEISFPEYSTHGYPCKIACEKMIEAWVAQ